MNKRHFLIAVSALMVRPAWALYDPKPNAFLTSAIGSWRGTLTYADYQKPDRLVTLQTKLTVSLTGPDELALYYAFDDGPGKIVYSYERMLFDFSKNELAWISGAAKPGKIDYKLTSAKLIEGNSVFQFERTVDAGVDKYDFEIAARSWVLTKREVRAGKPDLQRSKYEFTKET